MLELLVGLIFVMVPWLFVAVLAIIKAFAIVYLIDKLLTMLNKRCEK